MTNLIQSNFIQKSSIIAFGSIILLTSFSACNTKKEKPESKEVPEVKVLGLKPPGMTPELFAPGIVSTKSLEINAAFSPEMDELYFTRQVDGERPKNLGIRFVNGTYETFYEDAYSGEIFITNDNQRMFLGNKFKERTASGWSEEKNMEAPYDSIRIMRLTSSINDTYIFDERDTIGTLRISKVIDGVRSEPIALEGDFKKGTYTAHPFIAPDESYIIWDSSQEQGYGDSDLYISFRQDDDSWGPAINLGEEINSDKEDAYGSISPDGKYFIFHRITLGETFEESYAEIFWVDAKAVLNLKNK